MPATVLRLQDDLVAVRAVAHPGSGHPKLWELTPGPHRVFYFAHVERTFILLHAYRKKSQKAPAREIRTAEHRMAELMEG